jgi:hypothetical protein
LELAASTHTDLFRNPRGCGVSVPDQADEPWQPEALECVVPHGRCGFGGQAAVPIVAADIVSELGFVGAFHVAVLQTTIADKDSISLVEDREQPVAVTLLVLEVARDSALHLELAKWLDAESGHHFRVAERHQKIEIVTGRHWPKHKPIGLEDHRVAARRH